MKDDEYICKDKLAIKRKYSRYCLWCKKDICIKCSRTVHKNHQIKNYDDLLKQIDDEIGQDEKLIEIQEIMRKIIINLDNKHHLIKNLKIK